MALTGVSSSLISLGTVFKKGLLSRPSKLIKSPYVADVIDNGFEQNPFSVIDRDEELKKTHKRNLMSLVKNCEMSHIQLLLMRHRLTALEWWFMEPIAS